MAEQITDRNMASISEADVTHLKTVLEGVCKTIFKLSEEIFKEIGGNPKNGGPVTCCVKFDEVSEKSKNELIGCSTRIAHTWSWLNNTLNALFLDPNVESTIDPPPDPPGDGKP